LKGHDFSRAANAQESTMASQAAEKLIPAGKKRQGTTLVVP
jgi:hypothetical protein